MIAFSPLSIGNRPRRVAAHREPEATACVHRSFAASPYVLLASVLFAGGINFVIIWNHFYADVPFLFDTGWYAALVHRASPLIENPASVTFATIGPLFYATHLSPILWILSLPSHVLPVSPPVWLACVEALKHALIAVGGWGLVRALSARNVLGASADRTTPFVATLTVLLLPFNGLLLAGMAYPHFELWFLPPALAFLWALFCERYRLATVAFVTALMVREDIGFHLCGLLLVATAFQGLGTRRWERRLRPWLLFAVAGFGASVAALVVMRTQFPGDSAFTRIYTGEPAYAHLTWSAIRERLGVIGLERGYLWMPVLVYAVWAIAKRAWWVLVGYAAFVPWFVFNLSAASLSPATLSLYYVFPFALALLWPLAGALAFAQPVDRARVPAWVAAGIVASIIGFAVQADVNRLERTLAGPDFAAKARLDMLIDRLASSRAAGQSVLVDDAIAAFAPTRFAATNLVGQHAGRPDIAAFYSTGRATKAAWETSLNQPYHYILQGTEVVVSSANPLDWPSLVLKSQERGSIEAVLRHERAALDWVGDPTGEEPPQTVVIGPHGWFLAPEVPWLARFALTVGEGKGSVLCEVLANGAILASTLVTLNASGADTLIRNVPFVVPTGEWQEIKLRVRARGTMSGRVDDVALRPATGRDEP